MSWTAGGFFGNRIVAASWRPGVNAELIERLRTTVGTWTRVEGAGWLLASERADAFAQVGGSAVVLGRRNVLDRAAGVFRTPAEVGGAVSVGNMAMLAGMAPPFRCALADPATGVLRAETDAFGLGQMFVGSDDKFAALASSATLLADILVAGLCPERLAGYAVFGGFIGEETPFKGVDKLLAGTSVSLEAGRATLIKNPRPQAGGGDLTETFRAAVDAMLRAAPDAELELSGGLDSRLILAAMPADARKGRRAITLGLPGAPSEDVTVARGIAELQGLDWTLLDVGGVARFEASDLAALLQDAARAYDHMANPIDKVALILAGHGRRVDERFGGQNGEILRGFYYPAQPLQATPSEDLARGLISMRLKANDCVEESILSQAGWPELRASAEARMVRQLLSFDGSWGEALDQFYLFQRMQTWVGNATGHRLMDHALLYPFFDPAFVAAAMATPVHRKLNSRAAYQLLHDLDPDLARLPLASGGAPSSLLRAGAGQDLWLTATRIAGRLKRLAKRRGRDTLGSQTVAQQWRRLNLNEAIPLDRLTRSGLFDPVALEAISAGQRTLTRPSLGFLLTMTSLETR